MRTFLLIAVFGVVSLLLAQWYLCRVRGLCDYPGDLYVGDKTFAILQILLMMLLTFLLGYALSWHLQEKTLVFHREQETRLQSEIHRLKTPPKKPIPQDIIVIKGIGPAIKQKLEAMGYQTLQQISTLTEEDILKITQTLRHFPGRIQRERWVEQAREILSQHQNVRNS